MSVRLISNIAELKAVIAQPRLTVVDFFATWCGPCQHISPKLEELAAQKQHVSFCKVDVDKSRDILQTYPVRAMPTFKLFKSGTEIESFEGADYNRLLSLIQNNEVLPPPPIPSDSELEAMKPKELLTLMRQHHISSAGILEKSELISEIKKYR